MAAEQSADAFERMASEFGTFTFLYVRRNPAGLWVRDAKFIETAGTYDVAVGLFQGFADFTGDVDVQLCAVLRGKVITVDDLEFADQAPTVAPLGPARRFTVFGSWDTGDGPRRYCKHVNAAGPAAAELLARHDKTVGSFLVAGVVEGWVAVEDADEVWATVDGQPVPPPDMRPWWRRKLDDLTR